MCAGPPPLPPSRARLFFFVSLFLVLSFYLVTTGKTSTLSVIPSFTFTPLPTNPSDTTNPTECIELTVTGCTGTTTESAIATTYTPTPTTSELATLIHPSWTSSSPAAPIYLYYSTPNNMWALSHNLNATVNVIAFGPGAVPPINNPADRWSCSNDGVFEVNRVDIKCTKRKEGAAPAPVSAPVPAPVPAPIPSPSKPSKPAPSSPSSPVSDLFSSTTNPFPTSTSFIDHVTPLLTTALTVCQNTTLPTFLSTYSPLPDFPANLGATGNPFCRGRNYLYQNTDIVTGVLHVTPPSQYVANSYNYLVLYPCTADATNDLSTFHKTTYWAGFHGAGLITPIITPLTLPLPGHDSFPIFVLSFRPLIPGSYVLNILPRWVHDTMDLDTPLLFTGESEKRACPGPDGRKGSPGKWCLNRANGGRSEWNCRLQGVLVDAAVTVGENERSV